MILQIVAGVLCNIDCTYTIVQKGYGEVWAMYLLHWYLSLNSVQCGVWGEPL